MNLPKKEASLGGEAKNVVNEVKNDAPSIADGQKGQTPAHIFLRAIGVEDGQTVYYRAIQKKPEGKNSTRKQDAPFPQLPGTLNRLNADGFGVYVVINAGGETDKAIESCRAMFCEHDDLPKDEQRQLWQRKGLPEPTIQVDTGGKSIHSYWVLDAPLAPGEWKPLQAALLDHVDGDRTIKNPSRVMRLPGYRHQGTGEMATIVSHSGKRYAAATLRRAIQKTPPPPPPIALDAFLCRDSQDALNGVPEGQRNPTGFKLACDLLGCADWLRTRGVQFDGDPEGLFRQFADRCSPPLPEAEVNRIWQSATSEQREPATPVDKLTKRLDYHRRHTTGDTPPPDTATGDQGDDMDNAPTRAKDYQKLRKFFGDRLRYNIIKNRVELDGEPFDLEMAKLDLEIDHRVVLKSTDDCVAKMIVKLSRERKYSPVVDYLEQVHKPGCDTSILKNLAARYFGTTDTIHQVMLARFLIAAVARAYQPGCKVDTVLVLQGDQGYFKSTFFRVMAGDEWFDDSLGHGSDKDERIKLHRFWFLEWSELEKVFKEKQMSYLKAFITCQVDTVRPPYGKTYDEMKRSSVIVGSTNKRDFLTDPTGNRRFWVIPVRKSIDFELLARERDRIWAAAVELYKSGEQHFLTKGEEQLAAAANASYQYQDPWQAKIEAYLEHRSEVTLSEILESALQLQTHQLNKSNQTRAGDILKSLDWEPGGRKRQDGKILRTWRNKLFSTDLDGSDGSLSATPSPVDVSGDPFPIHSDPSSGGNGSPNGQVIHSPPPVIHSLSQNGSPGTQTQQGLFHPIHVIHSSEQTSESSLKVGDRVRVKATGDVGQVVSTDGDRAMVEWKKADGKPACAKFPPDALEVVE